MRRPIPPSTEPSLTTAASQSRHGRDDATRQPTQRQRLQPHVPRAAQRREEQAFAAEKRALDVADVLDVVVDTRLKGDETSRVDAQRFTRSELALINRAAGVNEREAVALQALQDEAFAAEESAPSRLVKAMPRLTPLAAQRKESFCASSSPPISLRCTGMILPGYGAPNAMRAFAGAAVLEHRHEHGFAREQALACAHQCAHEAAGGLLRTVAEDGFHLDFIVHVHHAAGFGDDGFVGVELDFDELHVVAKNLVVDFVHRAAWVGAPLWGA